MKFMGLDYGAKRIGVAVSDAGGSIAFPRAVVPNNSSLLEEVRRIAAEESVERIVVGDTRSHGGAKNPVTDDAERFITELRAAGLPVEAAFEAWSSIEASRYAPKGMEHDDAAAAAVILQRYLDMHAGGVR